MGKCKESVNYDDTKAKSKEKKRKEKKKFRVSAAREILDGIFLAKF